MKTSLKGKWTSSTIDEVLSNLNDDFQPLDKVGKSKLPLFGFKKLVGQRSNAQQYPVQYIILELDNPKQIKERISNGCIQTFEIQQAKFWMLFNQLKYDRDVPYYWMYITPSTCGIRFVLKTDSVVENEEEYFKSVLAFLRLIYLKTNGAINQSHFDLLVNQAWYVPTFKTCFDRKEASFTLPQFKKDNLILNDSKLVKKVILPKSTMEFFEKAVALTQRKMEFVNGQRNKFTFLLACNCNRFGLNEEIVIQEIERNYYWPQFVRSRKLQVAVHS